MTYLPSSFVAAQDTASATNLPVVLLHGSAMDPTVWTGLREHMGARFTASAPDLPGYGSLGELSENPKPSLRDICEHFAAEILATDRPVHLVGHDYGAVLALKIAAAYPGLVASLALIEPTAYNAVFPACEDAWEIHRHVAQTTATMGAQFDRGNAVSAMQSYVDLINGPGTWERTSRSYRQTLAERAGTAWMDLRAIAQDQMTADEIAGVVCPVLLIRGNASRWMTQQVAKELCDALPFLQEETVEGAAHFPHLSDPHIVDPMIVAFLERVNGQWRDAQFTLGIAA